MVSVEEVTEPGETMDGKDTISVPGSKRAKSDGGKNGSAGTSSTERDSGHGLSTLDKALLASDAARLANAIRKKAKKKNVDDVVSATDNLPTGKRKKIINKAKDLGDAAKKVLDKAAWGRGFKKIKPILKLPRGKRFAGGENVTAWELEEREKRQALLGMGSVLVGGYIVEHEWDWIKGQLGIGTGEPASGVVQQVNANEDHARVLGTHVDGLEKATMELRQKVEEGLRLSLIHI